MKEKPNLNSESAKELDRVEKQFDDFAEKCNQLTLDRASMAPTQETEAQTKLSQQEIAKKQDIYLKPHRTVSASDKFNEKWREQFNFAKEYVQFIAENKEIIGEDIDVWTRPFGGMPAEWWKVPVNKPVWGPRYLAEQIKSCKYHRLVMQNNQVTGADGMGTYHGNIVADTTVQRLDALPVSTRKSIFMGSTSFN